MEITQERKKEKGKKEEGKTKKTKKAEQAKKAKMETAKTKQQRLRMKVRAGSETGGCGLGAAAMMCKNVGPARSAGKG